jgi:hypothetical protein
MRYHLRPCGTAPHLWVPEHVALCRLQLPADQTQQRGLADAVGTHNRKAAREVEPAAVMDKGNREVGGRGKGSELSYGEDS